MGCRRAGSAASTGRPRQPRSSRITAQRFGEANPGNNSNATTERSLPTSRYRHVSLGVVGLGLLADIVLWLLLLVRAGTDNRSCARCHKIFKTAQARASHERTKSTTPLSTTPPQTTPHLLNIREALRATRDAKSIASRYYHNGLRPCST